MNNDDLNKVDKIVNFNSQNAYYDYLASIIEPLYKEQISQYKKRVPTYVAIDSMMNLFLEFVDYVEIFDKYDRYNNQNHEYGNYYIRNYDIKPLGYIYLNLDVLCDIYSRIIEVKPAYKRELHYRFKQRLKHDAIKKEIKVLSFADKNIILFKNAIYDVDNKEIKEVEPYITFKHSINYNLLNKNNTNKDILILIDKLFDKWSRKNKDIKIYLKQLCLATIEGYCYKKYNIIKSRSENGKFLFIKMLEQLSNNLYTDFSLNQITHDKSLLNIKDTDKLLLGKDLPKDFKLKSSKILGQRYRVLTTLEEFFVNVPYSNPIYFTSPANKIQFINHNTDMTKFIDTPAMKSRSIIYNWPSINGNKFYNELKINKFIINDKLSDEFMENLYYYILNDTTIKDGFIDIKNKYFE